MRLSHRSVAVKTDSCAGCAVSVEEAGAMAREISSRPPAPGQPFEKMAGQAIRPAARPIRYFNLKVSFCCRFAVGAAIDICPYNRILQPAGASCARTAFRRGSVLDTRAAPDATLAASDDVAVPQLVENVFGDPLGCRADRRQPHLRRLGRLVG